MKKTIKTYVMYNHKHNIVIECTERYVDAWIKRGFVIREEKNGEKKE